jgi:hypothetical protein
MGDPSHNESAIQKGKPVEDALIEIATFIGKN